MSGWDRSPRTNWQVRWFAWSLALLILGLVTGVVVAATSDPDWDGTKPEKISGSADALQPDIASSPSGQVAVVWRDNRSGQWNVYAMVSDDNGHKWSGVEVVTVTATADIPEMPDVLIAGDRVFVGWREQATGPSYAIYEAEITGTLPLDVRRVPDTLAVRQASSRPRLAAGGGRLHVVYNGGDETAPDILYAVRPLTATAWPTATVMYTHTGARGSWYPALAVGPDEQTLHVVWEERVSESQWTAMYMSGTLNSTGVDWSPVITLSTAIEQATWPDIVTDSSGNLHIVFGEVGAGGYSEQYVNYMRYDTVDRQWTDAGRIDPGPVDVNTTSPTFSAPRLALLEQNDQFKACVAWHGFRQDDPEAEEVLLRCSPDGADNWSSTKTESVSRSSDKEHQGQSGWFVSIWPSITFDASGQLHVVWQERTGASLWFDYAIYHSRSTRKVFLPLVMRNG